MGPKIRETAVTPASATMVELAEFNNTFDQVSFAVTPQNVDWTTAFEFNASDIIHFVVQCGMSSVTNEVSQVLTTLQAEGVVMDGNGSRRRTTPATGAGDTFQNEMLFIDGMRKLVSGGTKLLRIVVDASQIGNATFEVINRKVYRVRRG